MLSFVVAAAIEAVTPAPVAAIAPPDTANAPITVTGRHLKDYAADVDTCVAGRCSPRKDIVVSIRYAEAQFRSGDYRGARQTLARATARNAEFGAQEPVALSQLYLAQANVAAHFGEQGDVRAATIASARVADEFLPVGDPNRLWADLRRADWRLESERLERVRDYHIADPAYIAIAADARAAGHDDIAAAATLHLAWAQHARRDDDRALRTLAVVAATPGDAVQPYRLAGRVLTARIARARGDKGAIDAVIAAMRNDRDRGAPVLVYSPPTPVPTDPAYRADPTAINVDSVTRPGDNLGLRWVDIGFAIRSDGTVDTPEVLRGSRSPGWATPLLTAIAARRYSPTADDAAAPGHYRIERYTLTADFRTPIGSLIRQRISAPRIEKIDLTDDPPARAS